MTARTNHRAAAGRRPLFTAALILSLLPLTVSVATTATLRIRPATDDKAAAWEVRAILITETDKTSRGTAQWLQSNLKRLTGVTVPINPKDVAISPEADHVILLGRGAVEATGAMKASELEDLDWFGFVVRTNGKRVVISGRNLHGTAYGAVRFLEQQGCEFFSRITATIPRIDSGVLTVTNVSGKPFFDGKRIHTSNELYGMPGDVIGDPRSAFKEIDGEEVTDRTVWIDHTAPFLVPKKLYYDEHPEYYALRGDGTRLPKDTTSVRTVICTTHPDVLKISTERVLQWIAKQPDRRYFVVMQADDHTWCRCERCRAMVYEGENYSDAMLYWVNHVARAVAAKYPDKILICHAYGPTQPPPVKLKPEPNVHVMYCSWPGPNSAPCGIRDFDAPQNRVARDEILGWLKIAPHNIGLYDYNAGGRYTVNGMAWKVKWAARHGLRGFWYCGSNQSFSSLFAYVQSRLNWNPQEEVARLKERFIRAHYGPAAEPMAEVINGIYDRIEHGNYDGRMHGVPPADFYTMAFTEKVLTNFDRALLILKEHDLRVWKEVASDRDVFLENCLKRTRPSGREFTDEELAVFGLCLKPFLDDWRADYEQQLAEFEVGKRKSAPTYDSLATVLWNLARVRINPAVEPGGEPELVAALRRDPVATIRKHMVTDLTEKTPDGWRLPAEAFSGGRFFRNYDWKCEARDGIGIYGKMTEFATASGTITLPSPVEKAATLELLGQDSDKLWCAAPPLQIFVNGKMLFDDKSPFVKQGWSTLKLPVPAGLLRKGPNRIELRNGANTDHLTAAWTMVSEVRLVAVK